MHTSIEVNSLQLWGKECASLSTKLLSVVSYWETVEAGFFKLLDVKTHLQEGQGGPKQNSHQFIKTLVHQVLHFKFLQQVFNYIICHLWFVSKKDSAFPLL